MKPAYHRQGVKRQMSKAGDIIRVIIQYSSRNTGTTQVEKGRIEETKSTT
jgi:hypothetical protein